ncbi:hypothetical protein FACS1894186_5240 [Alphaproteobacteria bacterium]|nr:hypothetical protein FACS1894186_5240 [Alphaproteobacteria bacterium]
MKKVLLAASAAMAVMALAAPARAVDSTGCGLGSLAWRGQRGILPQMLAVTTNGTFLQSLAIPSGTMGCDPNGLITGGTQKMFGFLQNNLEQYASDAASGSGETLAALAEITGQPYEKVARVSRDNFDALFPSQDTSAAEVAAKLDALLKA